MVALNAIGYEEIIVGIAPIGFTAPTGLLPKHALFLVRGAAVRRKSDGANPTSTSGMFYAEGTYVDWTDPEKNYQGIIQRAQFVRDANATQNATLVVEYYG